jgi:hypothetical protein
MSCKVGKQKHQWIFKMVSVHQAHLCSIGRPMLEGNQSGYRIEKNGLDRNAHISMESQ